MNKIMWIELKRFVKNNYKQAVILALVIGLAYSLVSNFLLTTDVAEEDTDMAEDSIIVTEEQAEYFTGFEIYIEYEDGRSFTNTTLLEEYVIEPEVVQEAEAETGVAILSRMEELEETGFEKQGNNRGVLGVIRGDHSHIFTILVNVGSNSDNMEVAEYYFNELTRGNVNFIENKDVYVWSEPQLLVESDSEIPEPNDMANGLMTGFAFDVFLGTVFGLIVSTLTLFLMSILRNENLYSFSYNRGSDDVFLLHESAAGTAGETAQLIAYPLNYDKVIIHDTELPKDLKSELDSKLSMLDESRSVSFVSKMSDAHITSAKTEVVILLDSEKDSKKWYNAQRKLADIYNLPVKVVQINR